MPEDRPRLVARSGGGWSTAAPERPARAADDAPFAEDEETRYQCGAELGQGGMGRVVTALDRRLRRQVALKRIAGDVRDRQGMAQRFAREAWITASLNHPAIVPVFDAGRDPSGEPFYVMRLIRGRTLGAAVLAARALPERLLLLRHFLGACEAVAYAHSQGVVHRDLKPDNILVADFGETQVVDWGVARLLQDAEASPLDAPDLANLAVDAGRTAAGAIIGTPAYMSPEQAAGAAPDPRADVYSLGAVLYEVITGKPPYQGPSASAVLSAVRSVSRAALRAVQPDTPPELAAIAERALAREPDARYPDARALAADVARYLDGRRVAAHRYSLLEELSRWARRFRAPLLVAAPALLALLLLNQWALWRTRNERDRALSAEQRTSAALREADRHLAHALLEQALVAQSVDAQPEAEVLAANALALSDSPEARGVLAGYRFAGRPLLQEKVALPPCRLKRVSRGGSLLCVTAEAVVLYAGRPLQPRWRWTGTALDASWQLDGARVLVLQNGGAAPHATDDGDHGALLDARDGRELSRFADPVAGPLSEPAEGGALAAQINSRWVSLLDTRSGTQSTPTPCRGPNQHLCASVSGDDSTLVVACRDGSVALLDHKGRLRRRVQTEFLGPQGGLSALALSPDQRTLVVASVAGGVRSLDAQSGAVLAGGATALGLVRALRFSPDGQRVAILSERGGVSIWDPRTWALVRRFPAERDQDLQWSADGAELWLAGRALTRWSLPRSQPVLRLMAARPPGLAGLDLSPGRARLALAAGDGTLTVLDVRSGRTIFTDRFQDGVLKGARFVDGGASVLAWAAGRPALRRYHADGAVLQTLDLDIVKRAALLPSGWLVLADYGEGLLLLRPPLLPRRAGRLVFVDADQSGDERTVVLLDQEGWLWQVSDGAAPRARALWQRKGAHAVALAADGGTMAVADPQGIEVLDAATGVTQTRFAAPGALLRDLALSPDGSLLAAGGDDHAAWVWSTSDGRLRAVLRGHNARVSALRFADDGHLLGTASWDGSARLWDLDVLERPAPALRAAAEREWGLTLEEASRAPIR